MAFDLSNYEPVEDRIAKFWADHADGSIDTALIEHGDGYWVVRATVQADGRLLATGLAQENVTAKGVNSTSALENCETSAIGRALANAGYAAKGARASREEMSRVNRSEAPSAGGGRIDALKDAIKAAEAWPWVNAQKFPYPWPDDVCDAIEAHLEGL